MPQTLPIEIHIGDEVIMKEFPDRNQQKNDIINITSILFSMYLL